jgi:hypothetical protein
MKQIRNIIITLVLPVIFFTGCQKDCAMTVPVVVDAGNSQVVQLPDNLATLTGVVKSALTPGTNYLWTLISGPSAPEFTHNDSIVTDIKNLVEGTYVLQLQATNNLGMSGFDTTSVVVAAPVTKTLTLQPGNNENEASPDSYFPLGSGHGGSQISANAWTRGGLPENNRIFIKFDYNSLPAGATITSATLTLFATPTPMAGNYVDAHFGDNNACGVQRITSDWSGSSINWNNQPTHTAQNAAVIPQSTSSFQTDVVDVTQLVKDMRAANNYGFAIILQNEIVYNSRQYASSFYSDPAKWPKLEIKYQ